MLRWTVLARGALTSAPPAPRAGPRAPDRRPVLDRLAGEPDQPQALEVVEIRRHPLTMLAAGLGPIMFSPHATSSEPTPIRLAARTSTAGWEPSVASSLRIRASSGASSVRMRA